MNSERPDTRQHILDCGQRLIAAKGFVGVGLAEILGSAGVPKGSFYHYFPSKEVFGSAVLDSYFASYLAYLDTLFARADLSGAQRLLAYFDHWIEVQCGEDNARKCLIVKLGAEVSDLSEAMRATMLHGTEQILARLAACIAAGQSDASVATRQEPAECALWLYETWLGAALLAKLHRDGTPMDAAMRQTRKVLAQTD